MTAKQILGYAKRTFPNEITWTEVAMSGSCYGYTSNRRSATFRIGDHQGHNGLIDCRLDENVDSSDYEETVIVKNWGQLKKALELYFSGAFIFDEWGCLENKRDLENIIYC